MRKNSRFYPAASSRSGVPITLQRSVGSELDGCSPARSRTLQDARDAINRKEADDPANPQTLTLPTGKVWSGFFNKQCADDLEPEDWEQNILSRMVDQMALFRTQDGQRFLYQFYTYLDNSANQTTSEHAYRFEESVGEIAFIDKILARKERHRLVDYKICISFINRTSGWTVKEGVMLIPSDVIVIDRTTKLCKTFSLSFKIGLRIAFNRMERQRPRVGFPSFPLRALDRKWVELIIFHVGSRRMRFMLRAVDSLGGYSQRVFWLYPVFKHGAYIR